MRTLYKFSFRKDRNIQVCFQSRPDKWISTGTKNKIEAEKFAIAHLNCKVENSITFGQFLKDNWQEDLRELHQIYAKELKPIYYQNLASLIKSYILPIFGHYIISKISLCEMEDLLVKSKLNNLTKNRIVQALREIYHLAIRKNLVSENTAEKLEKFKVESKETKIFQKEEIYRLFQDEANFSNLKWMLYFLILRDTGWRPSEVLSLQFENISKEGGVYTDSSVVYDGSKMVLQNKIKTSNKGQRYKIGILSQFTLSKLEKIENRTGLLFDAVTSQEANRELKKACRRAKVEIQGCSQYSFRHTFNTLLYSKLDEQTRLELMGHTRDRKEYDHRTAIGKLMLLLSQKNKVEILQNLY